MAFGTVDYQSATLATPPATTTAMAEALVTQQQVFVEEARREVNAPVDHQYCVETRQFVLPPAGATRPPVPPKSPRFKPPQLKS